MSKANNTASTKLPKGEFPSNIHILKGPSGVDGGNSRGPSASGKQASK